MHRQHTPDLSIPETVRQRRLRIAFECAGGATMGVGFALLLFIGWSL